MDLLPDLQVSKHVFLYFCIQKFLFLRKKMKYGPLNPPSWGQFLQLFANKVLKNNLRGDFLDKRGK